MTFSRPLNATSENAFFRVRHRSIMIAFGPYSTSFVTCQRGVDDLREAITLDEFKLLLDASAEWERLTMPNVDPGKDTSQ